jgi:hypothetical protein
LADFLRNNFINIIRSSAPDKATADRTISQIPKFAFGDPKVVYQDERVVDPATGLLYQETEIKTTQTVVNVQEQVNAKIEIRDSSEYSYRYQ